TGIINHFKFNTCPNAQNILRDDFYRRIYNRNPQGVISKTLIDWNSKTEYKITVYFWNISGYKYYLYYRVL
ncbi:hypothetical protein PoMZ_09264, partial [Pyricularia oryzae]